MPKVLNFPESKSIGKLWTRSRQEGQLDYKWSGTGTAFGDAKGKIIVDDDQEIMLELNEVGCQDLSVLSNLDPESITGLVIFGKPIKNREMKHVFRLKSLRALWILNTNFSDEGLAGLEDLKCLEKVSFWGTEVGNAVTSALVGSSATLRDIEVVGSKFADEGLAPIRGMKNLNRLNLGSTGVSDKGLSYLCDSTNLAELTLSNCDVGDQGVEYIGNLKEIYDLSISNTRITDHSAEVFSHLTNLRKLRVHETALTDGCIPYLLSLPLRKLTIHSCALTKEGHQRLREGLPDCDINDKLDEP